MQMGPFVDEEHPLVKSGDGFVHDADGNLVPLSFQAVFECKGACAVAGFVVLVPRVRGPTARTSPGVSSRRPPCSVAVAGGVPPVIVAAHRSDARGNRHGSCPSVSSARVRPRTVPHASSGCIRGTTGRWPLSLFLLLLSLVGALGSLLTGCAIWRLVCDGYVCSTQRLYLYANPSMFTINGVVFGASSVDILYNLNKEITSKYVAPVARGRYPRCR